MTNPERGRKMVRIRPFRAFRPAEDVVDQVAALPYDVMTSDEARVMVKDKPLSFLHIDRGEISLPEGTDPHAPEVYEKAKEVLEKHIADGVFIQEETPRFYVYRLTMDGRTQTGLVCCASTIDYDAGVIKKHELTRADKEEDRVRHVDTLDANTGPIFLACRLSEKFAALLDKTVSGKTLYDFTAEDGARHEVWLVDEEENANVISIFDGMDALYIADGHHRCASAARVGKLRREQNPGGAEDEEYNFFLCVVFPEEQLKILDYNRVVTDLNGLTQDEFLDKLRENFAVDLHEGEGPSRPGGKHQFGMYLGGAWYLLTAKPGVVDDGDPVARLDVSVLQDLVLAPILGIADPRTDERIDFIGGIRGLSELKRRVNLDMEVAFAMYATSMEDLFDIADAGLIMPPKSTWFEPKLRSGLFIHKLK